MTVEASVSADYLALAAFHRCDRFVARTIVKTGQFFADSRS
jgi:hypothetical protein